MEMLKEFERMCDVNLGSITVSKHRIDLLNDKIRPVYTVPYRAEPTARQLAAEEINRVLTEEAMEPPTTEWSAPIVLAPKKGGPLCFCVDYRKLNAVTICGPYQLPSMDACIDSMRDIIVFYTQGANSGY